MKTIWNVVAIMAVANLIALAGVFGWLKATDRLNSDRLRAIRTTFTTTIAQDAASLAQQKADAELAQKEQDAAIKAARPPLTAAEKLAARVEATEQDRARMERLRREVEDLQKSLARERSNLDTQRERLTADQKAFDEQVNQVGEVARTEQFQKTLGILQSLKPAAAKSMLLEVMNASPTPAALAAQPADFQPVMGANTPASIEPARAAAPPSEDGRRIAVEYLNAMDDRARTKVMAEFVKDDPALAAQLLESLRKRGQFARTDARTSP